MKKVEKECEIDFSYSELSEILHNILEKSDLKEQEILDAIKEGTKIELGYQEKKYREIILNPKFNLELYKIFSIGTPATSPRKKTTINTHPEIPLTPTKARCTMGPFNFRFITSFEFSGTSSSLDETLYFQ